MKRNISFLLVITALLAVMIIVAVYKQPVPTPKIALPATEAAAREFMLAKDADLASIPEHLRTTTVCIVAIRNKSSAHALSACPASSWPGWSWLSESEFWNAAVERFGEATPWAYMPDQVYDEDKCLQAVSDEFTCDWFALMMGAKHQERLTPKFVEAVLRQNCFYTFDALPEHKRTSEAVEAARFGLARYLRDLPAKELCNNWTYSGLMHDWPEAVRTAAARGQLTKKCPGFATYVYASPPSPQPQG